MTAKAICPKCGYPDIYLGATAIECGYDPQCENYSEKQAEEVKRLMDVRFPSANEVEDQLELDWSPEEDDTQPYGITADTAD